MKIKKKILEQQREYYEDNIEKRKDNTGLDKNNGSPTM